MSAIKIYVCNNVEISGTTPVIIRQTEEGFEARVGVSILGATNMNEKGFEEAEYNPFSDKFFDNYADGFGLTEEEAIESLKKDIEKMTNSIWGD